FEFKPEICDGIAACKMALLKKDKKIPIGNFIEGMACEGGCIGGAGCLTHGAKSKADVDKYGRLAYEKKITEAVSVLK
ncbi:MAG: ferredoxin, partial [Spirochaetales bacterium]|nr:ferredoxin [Spirochaetales bacterium]